MEDFVKGLKIAQDNGFLEPSQITEAVKAYLDQQYGIKIK